MVLHNSFGMLLAEQVVGAAIQITDPEGDADSRRVFVRNIAANHILEDLGFIPSLAECLAELPMRAWMAGATAHAEVPRMRGVSRGSGHSFNKSPQPTGERECRTDLKGRKTWFQGTASPV